MKNPSFDPSRGSDDEFLDQQESELYQQLLAKLKENSSNRWHYDAIDYCWTGKDADLEWHGDQGLHLDRVTNTKVTATVHCGKNVPGSDVCLNLPESATDEQQERAQEIYLEQAQEIVIGAGTDFGGEWSGDDWFITTEIPIECVTVLNPETNELDAEATFKLLDEAAAKAVEYWDKEMKIMDKMIDGLCGWRDKDGNQVKEGEPPEGSVWDMVNWEEGRDISASDDTPTERP